MASEEKIRLVAKFSKLAPSTLFTERQHINKFDAGVILLSLSYGSAVVILPYTVKELGILPWFIVLLLCLILAWYCTQVLNHSTRDLFEEKEMSTIKDPYPELAEYAMGLKFRRVLTVTMHVSYFTVAIGFVLLSATLLNGLLPIDGFHKQMQIRIWVLICVAAASPLMFIGLYKDLVTTAYMAVATSSVALIGVYVNSFIARFDTNIINFPTEVVKQDISSIFRQYGVIVFALSGASYILPNVTIFMKKEDNLKNAISVTILAVFIIYLLAGLVPYYFFHSLVLPSITQTFSEIKKKTEVTIIYNVTLAIIQLTLSLHLLLVAVLVMNPVFRSVENYLRIPSEFTWKRVVVRSVGLCIILAVCFLLPYFSTVLSLVGAVPLTMLSFVYPIIIHMKIFKLTIFQTGFSWFLLAFSIVMMLGNLYVVISDIVDIYRKNGVFTIHHH